MKYLNSLRVIYPSIDAIINAMFIEAGEVPERFRCLVDKAQKLEQQGIIPYFGAYFCFVMLASPLSSLLHERISAA